MTESTVLSALRFNEAGLIAAIAVDHQTESVLMMAWMNRDAVTETVSTGRVCYFSRSRGKLWRKGESSNQVQTLVDFRIDCDGDTILLKVDQDGVACHTGRRDCFYRAWREGELKTIADVLIDPDKLYS